MYSVTNLLSQNQHRNTLKYLYFITVNLSRLCSLVLLSSRGVIMAPNWHEISALIWTFLQKSADFVPFRAAEFL